MSPARKKRPAAKRAKKPPAQVVPSIPPLIVEYFLLGRTRSDVPERYTQDGGIVSDVWLAFARDLYAPQRVLVAPSQDTTAGLMGAAIHEQVKHYRQTFGLEGRRTTGVSPLENFVATTIHADELIRVVLPLTSWWHRKKLSMLRSKAVRQGTSLDAALEKAILFRLGKATEKEVTTLRGGMAGTGGPIPDSRILEAAPIAALIGLFMLGLRDAKFLADMPVPDPRKPQSDAPLMKWIEAHAHEIARAARQELVEQSEWPYRSLQKQLVQQSPLPYEQREAEPPELIQRVFLDRRATMASTEDAICTIKCDAATRLFEVSCKTITWAVLDSGIATTHPAFKDHDAATTTPAPRGRAGPSRVRTTLDFTRIELIRNFDLIEFESGSPQRKKTIQDLAKELDGSPGRVPSKAYRDVAVKNLTLIAEQLDQAIPPDWNLIEPLMRLDGDDGSHLVSDHGTHVAGILGADWRDETNGGESILEGVCPQINLFDLRVIHEKDRQSTEFALLAALEYVQFVNMRAAGNGPVVHGVNISMSIPYDVRNYGCGATPICVACDRLSHSGVVVVAAAGNRGWNEQEIGFGNFVFSSITDPGNAQEVITVGSTHRLKPHAHGVSYFSSRGPTGDGRVKPDLVAPGEQIRGPVRGNADEEMDGTSMAAPFVSGAAALLLARHRELIGKPARVKAVLCNSATDLGREKYFQGHGLVDVLRALQSV